MPRLYRFGEFEFDPESGELTRRGRRVALQPQPARLLARLVERTGETVTREEIRQLLWSDSTHVEYEQGINFCVRQLRAALQDSAAHTAWIETLPRRGYRFRGPVQTTAAPKTRAATEVASPPQNPELPSATPTRDVPAADLRGLDSRVVVPASHRAASFRRAAVAAALTLPVALGILGWRATTAWREARPSDVAHAEGASPSPETAGLPPAATLAYERGLYWSRRDGRDVVERGIAELRHAAVLAPEAAEPLTALAEALLALHRYAPAAALLDEAEALSERAVALDPGLARAHFARAGARLQARYDWGSAERDYRRSLELDPNLAAAHRGYAALLAASGRLDEAVIEAGRARELDPVCLAASADLGWYLFLARRYDESIVASRAALALDPANTAVHLSLIYAQLLKGDEAAALVQANAHLAAYFSKLGRPAPRAPSLAAYWRGFVDHLGASGSESAPSDVAMARLSLGEDDAALGLLLRGCRDRSGRDPLFVAVNPLLESLRSDPRLREVVACVGLDPETLFDPGSARPPAVPAHGVTAIRG